MDLSLWWLLALPILATIVALWLLWPKPEPKQTLEQLIVQFRQERPRMEQRFFEVAASSGKPRGLRWKECQWNDLTEWVREKATGRLHALVGVTISFEA